MSKQTAISELDNVSPFDAKIELQKIESEKIQLVLHIFAYAVCALIGYIFVRYGYIYTLSGMKRTMMCCKIPIGYVYMIMPFSGLVIVINSIEMIVKGIRTLARGERRNG